MTINSEVRIAGPFQGNDIAVDFPFAFKVFGADEVLVVLEEAGAETVLELSVDYTVTLNADQEAAPGGQVTLIAGALASGKTLTLTSALAPLQPVDLTNQGGFYPRVINSSLDRLTILIQQLSERLGRTLVAPISDGAGGFGDLPGVVARRGSVLAFDEVTGAPLVGPRIGAVGTVVANTNAINAVASSIGDVNTVADNITDVTNFAGVYYGPSATDPTTRRDGSPLQEGDLYFNTTAGGVRVYSSSAGTWQALPLSAYSTVLTFSGDGVETVFALPYDPQREANTLVYISGAYQQKATYSLSGASIVFDTPPPLGVDNIEVILVEVNEADSGFREELLEASGAELVGYGAGTVATELERLASRVAGFLHASEFGLLGDGSDETAKVQAAVTAAAAQRKVLVGDRTKTYKITGQITGASNCHLRDINIDASAMTGTKHALVFQGALGSNSALTANAAANAFSLAVTDGALFSAGEWVLLTVDTSYYPYSTYNVARGEWVQIRSVVGNTINITTPLVQAYTTATGATLRKCNFVENVVLDNVRITGSGVPNSNERGVCFRFARNFSVRNCNFINLDQYALEASSSIRFWVSQNNFRGTFYDGVTGTIFYAIALVDACQYFLVGENQGARSRHLVVTTAASAGQGCWGQCMFGVIHDNVVEDCMAGGSGRSYAYEMHGTGQHLAWANNIANGCYSFMRIEGGSDSQVIGGGCNGYAYQGLIIGGTGQTVRNIDIRGVRLHNYTAEVGGLAAGIRFESTTLLENVTIDGVKITGASVANAGNAISIGTSTTSRNNRIKNVQASAGTVEANAVAVLTAGGVTGFSFDECDFFGWRQGYNFATGTSKLVVRGGAVENFAAGATGWGFYSNGDRNICKGVHFRNINTSIRLDTGSTNNLAVENTATDCLVPTPSNAGTGNTVATNYTV